MTRRRPFRAALLAAAVLLFATHAQAATPASGTINTTTKTTLTYTSGPFYTSNPSGELVDEGTQSTPTCSPAAVYPCDNFALTVTLPAGYSATYPGTAVRISMSFSTAAGVNPDGAEEFDLFVYDSSGNLISDSIANDPAVINLPVKDGTATYTVQIEPAQALGDSATTVLTLMPGAQPVTPTAPGPDTPRYQLYDPSGQGQGAVTGGGEDNIGFDLKTLNIMTMNEVGNVYDVKPPELVTDPENPNVKLPQSCQAVWTNVSNNSGDTTQVDSLDPILWTDRISGRTFQSNITAGASAFFSYTDNDGTSWTPASAAPPNGGADHETIATGPYPAGSQFATVAQAAGVNYATYYCSQSEVPDFCQRSDTGGSTFGPGVPITNGVTNTCTGLHGHAKVSSYDGSVYVPIRNCGALQGGSVSLDAGVTWNQFKVTGSTGNTSNFDPSMAVATDGTVYFCYVGADSHPHAAMSPGHSITGGAASDGATWVNDFDLGASQGIQSAVYVQMAAGDPLRASCGFLGTTTAGAWGVAGFPGVWKVYIASTFDGGKTWTTVDTDPNLIVQAAGSICNQGTTCSSSPNYRNLLDFNEATIDANGRFLYAFDLGCDTPTCQASPTVANNPLASDMRIMRQSGGKSLFAAFDNQANYAGSHSPLPSCLSGTRATNSGNLSWLPGDNGGNTVTSYKIYRSTTMGGEQTGSPLATVQSSGSNAAPTSYIDNSINSLPAGPVYYTVIGVNSVGQSVFSNEVLLGNAKLGGNVCALPGVTLANTSTGNAVTLGIPYADIVGLQIAEPDPAPTVQPTATTQSTALTFTIDVSSFNGLAAPPPNTSWTVEWNMPVSAPGTSTDKTSQTIFVSFDTYSQTDPTGELSFGYIDATTTPKSNQTQCSYGLTTGAARGATCQASGSYNASSNTITITLDTHAPISVANLATGSTLSAFSVNFNTKPLPTLSMVTAVVDQLAGAAGTGLIETLDTTGATSYTISGNYYCRPDLAPVAALSVTPGNGVASSTGLQETLDASGSTDASADTIVSYAFMPTSATSEPAQSSPTFNYAYPVGIYTASVSVTNDRGLSSSNSAASTLTISPLPPTQIMPSAGTASGSVNLSWTATASLLAQGGTSVYNVYYSTQSGGESNPSTTNASNAVTGINGTSTTITGLTPGVTYYFTIYTLAGPGNTLPSVSSTEVSLLVPAATTSNSPPTASLTATPTSGTAPLTVNFSGSGSTDPNSGGSVTSYTFNLGDGSAAVTQSSPTLSYTYSTAGTYTASLTVTDAAGLSSSNTAQQTITVTAASTPPASQPPMASFTATPTSGTAPLTVNLNASGSSDPNSGGSVTSYTFSFGDGSASVTQSSPTLSHVYSAAGTYTVSLTVTDSSGLSSTNTSQQTITVTVATASNNPPTASLSATPTSGQVPLMVNLDGSKSSDPDAGDSVSSYTFSFGDGSASVTQASATLSHTYTSTGTFTATLTVTDTHGASSTNTAQQTITVSAATTVNHPPTAAITATPTSGTVPLLVSFDASGSSDPDSGDYVASYRFDFGDGSAVITQTTPTVSHTYLSFGVYVASVTVTDTHAASSATPATTIITVTAAPPAPAPSQGRLGGAFGGSALLSLAGLAALRRRQRKRSSR